MDYKQMFAEKYIYLINNIDFIVRPNYTLYFEFEPSMLQAIEYLLLSDNDDCYDYIENLKKDKEYLKKYRKSLKGYNAYTVLDDLKINISNKSKCIDLLKYLYENIEFEESIAKSAKLETLDMFARVARYEEGKNWTSGCILNGHDLAEMKNFSAVLRPGLKEKQFASKVGYNNFIDYFYNNSLTNEEIKKLGKKI